MPARVHSDEMSDTLPRRRWRPGSALRHAVLTAVIVLGVLYGAMLAISRTSGFRGIVASRLGEMLGEDPRLGAAALTARLDLRIDRLDWGGEGRPGAAAIRAERIVLRPDWPWRPGRLRSVDVSGGTLSFALGSDGLWMPRRFAALGEGIEQWTGLGLSAAMPRRAPEAAPLPEARPAPASPDAGRPRDTRIAVVLRSMDVVWWDAAGARLAAIEGLDLDVTPVELPGRNVRHVRLAAAHMERERGEAMARVRLEFLDAGAQRFLLDFDAGGGE